MPKPTSNVLLTCDGINREQEFPFDQAQAMLQLQVKKKFKEKGYSCWELPPNSKFYFENGDLRRRSDKGANKKEAEKG